MTAEKKKFFTRLREGIVRWLARIEEAQKKTPACKS
jgi:hypothetical protein